MADYGSAQSPKINYRQLTSSIFSSFSGFTSKGCNETESIMSPTSTLDAKPFSSLKNPFWPNTSTPKTPKPESRTPFEKLDSRGLVDALIDDKSESGPSKSSSRMVLFGSKLKIQVPNVVSPNESPKSPVDFGIKTRNSHLGPFSPGLSASPARKSPFGSLSSGLSASEMELSEDYTCVISYGPNPRTTHIFDDCVVESCCGVVKFSESRRENNILFSDRSMSYPSESFLSFCYNCKRNLGQGKDIYMYRGEKAFCSSECRYREMMLEEDGLKSPEIDDIYCASS